MNSAQFASQSSIPEQLISAVVEQVGGWENFTELAGDVVEHGADAGFSGFTYYADTCKFARDNMKNIRAMVKSLADDLGESSINLVRGFNCLRDSDITEDDVGAVLYGNESSDETTLIENALAWFALEEVSRSYVDFGETINEANE